MLTVAIEDLMCDAILSFCENAAELGCPREKDVDMWFRELSDEEQFNVASKLLSIQERQKHQEDQVSQEPKEPKEEEDASEDYVMKTIKLDLDEDLIEKIIEIARSRVVNDRTYLIEYGVNSILKEAIHESKNVKGEAPFSCSSPVEYDSCPSCRGRFSFNKPLDGKCPWCYNVLPNR
jgi:hypothetical protein